MRRNRQSKHKPHRSYSSNRCHYCGASLSGIPHYCKFCKEPHCDKHILPEEHNCKGLNRPASWSLRHSESGRNHSSHDETYQHSSKPFKSSHAKKLEMPRIKIPRVRISTFFKALIIALITFFLAYKYPQYDALLWVEGVAWLYFSYVIFRKAFRWANRVSMADDLSFFGLRLLGGLVTVIGIYIMFATVIASVMVRGSAYQSIPIFCLLAGLILLGAFIAFRTNRRHHVVGFWRA